MWSDYLTNLTHFYQLDGIEQKSVLSRLKSLCGYASIDRDIIRDAGTNVAYGNVCKECLRLKGEH